MNDELDLRVLPSLARGTEAAFLCDAEGAVVDATATVAELLGRPPEAVRGVPFPRLAVEEDEEAVHRALEESRRLGHAVLSASLRGREGAPVDARISASALTVSGARLTLCLVSELDARRRAEERALRLADAHRTIAVILELALEEMPLDELLQRTLDLVLWIPWLSIERKGAIFVVEDAPGVLVLRASRGLSPPLHSACARVPFGTCLCGQAAASRAPVYAGHLDERHTTRYLGIADHGHYCVPIRGGDATLGVITTYLVPGHQPAAIEFEFLMAVADTLAGVIMRRRAHGEVEALRRQLAHVNGGPPGGR